jgi:hypothetical protein
MLSAPILSARRTHKKIRENTISKLLAQRVQSSLPTGAGGICAPIYWRSGHPCSFCRFGFPVVPGFRSFRLSGRSGFPVVPTFRSFRLSGRSSFPGNFHPFGTKLILKKKRTEQFGTPCLFTRQSPIHWALLTGNGNTLNKRRRQN